MYVYSHNNGHGSRALARALGCPIIRHQGSRFVGHRNKTVVNWGARELPEQVRRCRVLNVPPAIVQTTNKLNFFRLVEHHARIPEFTTERRVAERWLRDGHDVVARRVVAGSGGAGITVVSPGHRLPDVPLYTRYIPKLHEFRVHVVGGRVIDHQRKALRRGTPEGQINWKVRNLAGGFVYVRGGYNMPDAVADEALKAFGRTQLHFGAVDVIYNQKAQHAFVLEINTAPGLEGQTIQSYAEALRRL